MTSNDCRVSGAGVENSTNNQNADHRKSIPVNILKIIEIMRSLACFSSGANLSATVVYVCNPNITNEKTALTIIGVQMFIMLWFSALTYMLYKNLPDGGSGEQTEKK